MSAEHSGDDTLSIEDVSGTGVSPTRSTSRRVSVPRLAVATNRISAAYSEGLSFSQITTSVITKARQLFYTVQAAPNHWKFIRDMEAKVYLQECRVSYWKLMFVSLLAFAKYIALLVVLQMTIQTLASLVQFVYSFGVALSKEPHLIFGAEQYSGLLYSLTLVILSVEFQQTILFQLQTGTNYADLIVTVALVASIRSLIIASLENQSFGVLLLTSTRVLACALVHYCFSVAPFTTTTI
ncbi:hypothetical protein GMRT_14275 [Giardia muris]|uniref:Uncharacterized protein n=1 Tax=Giardia muris TaxID=5742 RepID=A0A4Z1SWQ3_GIAMU|nr:hypothetical protein GMRT_14275 [Giardia muris]|eukprot:TNJ30184.1 hypothetical protein GMRT_14275 [Giardia muris]